MGDVPSDTKDFAAELDAFAQLRLKDGVAFMFMLATAGDSGWVYFGGNIDEQGIVPALREAADRVESELKRRSE